MTKHNKQTQYTHNNKEFNRNNNPRGKGNGKPPTLTQKDCDSVNAAIQVVQDAFALLGKNTVVTDRKVGKFETRHISVRPVDDKGNPGLGLYGFESNWLKLYNKVAQLSSEKDVQAKLLAESQKFQNLLT